MKMPKPTISLEEAFRTPFAETFSWQDGPNGTVYTFDVDRIELRVADVEPVLVQIDPKFACSQDLMGGLEAHRLNRIPNDITTWPPCTMCDMPDGTKLLINGNHRYRKAFLMGYKNILVRFVPQSVWELCMIDIPLGQEALTGFSGIL